MSTILYNLSWMSFNAFLAILPVFFGWFAVKSRVNFVKWALVFMWLIYLPNTLYVITDLIYLPEQLVKVSFAEKIVIIAQYAVLEIIGYVSFILSIFFVEKMFTAHVRKNKSSQINILITFIIFLMCIGIVMGRVERANSWEVFTNPVKVVNDFMAVVTSTELLLMSFMFGLFGTTVYFWTKTGSLKLFRQFIK